MPHSVSLWIISTSTQQISKTILSYNHRQKFQAQEEQSRKRARWSRGAVVVETRGLAGETTTYGYDEADRLIGVAYPGETHLYRLDAVGNRTGEKRAAAGVVAALTVAAFAALSPTVASAAVERQHNAVDWVTAVVDVKASTTTALVYDANGNRTGEGTKQYAWDIRDTLTRVSDGASVVGTYDYDAKLQRVKADTTQGHVEYVLDGKYVLREAGARSRRYHFGEGEALAVTGVGGTSGQDRWLLLDALGSVVTEADASASSVTARQFDAWGNYRNDTAPTANETRLGYTGHQFDVETGLTYARARYYDSRLGIFLSRDAFEGSLADAPSLHRFTYAHNQPLKYRDPSGRCINFATGDWVTWSMCKESGKALGGYVAGMGTVALHAAVGVVDLPTGGAVSRGIEHAVHLGSNLGEGRFFDTREQLEAQQRGMLKKLYEGPLDAAKQELGEIQRLAETGDSFGLGRKSGIGVTTAALTIEGGRALGGEFTAVEVGPVRRISMKGAQDPLDANLTSRSGALIAEDPIAARSYQQIQEAGFEVELEFGRPPDSKTSAITWPHKGAVEVFTRNTGTATDTVSTIVHESSHVQSVARGRPVNTLHDEYMAFRREFLFKQQRRPTLQERELLWGQIKAEPAYSELPEGNVPSLFRGTEP